MVGRRLISCIVLSVIAQVCALWEGNKSRAAVLESVLLGGGK